MELVREIKTELPLCHALATGSKTHLPSLTLQSAPDKQQFYIIILVGKVTLFSGFNAAKGT